MVRLHRELARVLSGFLANKEGQSLPEYGLAVALIAFGCIAGMAPLAITVNQTFLTISTTIATHLQ